MMRSLRCPLVLSLLALGCTNGTPGGSSSSSSSGTGGQVNAGYAQVLNALCAYRERCRPTLGPLHSTVEACQSATQKELVVNRASYALTARHYGVDPTALTACVAALTSAACADRVPSELLGCADVLAPLVPAEVGDTCSLVDAEGTPRCVEGSTTWCNATATGCGTCAARLANGQDCRSNDQCLSGFCNTAGIIPPNKCENLPAGKGAGEGCFDTLECRGNLVCAGPLLGKKCAARAVAGEMCATGRNGDAPQCAQDLMCIGGTCARLRDAGSTCNRDPYAAGQAGCEGQCVFTAASLMEGQCQPLAALPTDGQACSLVVVGDGSVVPQCGDGLFTDDRSGAGCTCRAPFPAGSACLEDEACASQLCDGESGNTPGTCRALSQLNAACTRDADCESAYCPAGGTRTCQARPSCQ